jgi:hypothetical protein
LTGAFGAMTFTGVAYRVAFGASGLTGATFTGTFGAAGFTGAALMGAFGAAGFMGAAFVGAGFMGAAFGASGFTGTAFTGAFAFLILHKPPVQMALPSSQSVSMAQALPIADMYKDSHALFLLTELVVAQQEATF